MQNCIIVHGMPLKDMYYDPTTASPSNYHWIPWLQKQLIIRNILTQTPEMPRPFEPNFQDWKATLEQFSISEDTILIGHSGGAGFIARWLSEQKDIRVNQVILVAPWLDLDKQRTGNFFDGTVDPAIASRTKKLSMIYADNDDAIILKSVELIKQTVENIHVKELQGLGHFSHWDMPSPEFPQLLEELDLK